MSYVCLRHSVTDFLETRNEKQGVGRNGGWWDGQTNKDISMLNLRVFWKIVDFPVVLLHRM